MSRGINGINSVAAVILTAIVAVLAVVLFATGHPVWGVIFALIAVDFGADAVLAFQTA